jgi:hypothetical protein
MSERNTYEQAGDWLVGAVRRNPEALLVLAAGCALFMRSKDARHDAPRDAGPYYRDAEQLYRAGPPRQPDSGAMARAAQNARDYASEASGRVTDAVGGYASDVTGRVTDAASQYASTVSDYAGNVRDQVVSGASRLPDQARSTVQRGFARILRDQPLAIAAVGLAAGATLAAVFPATEAESQMLGPAHDAMVDAASRVAESVKSAAGETGEQLKEAARERGLDTEGLKGLAREVAGKFADNVTARPTEPNQNREPNSNDAPRLVPEHTGTGI